MEMNNLVPSEIRALFRQGKLNAPTVGLAKGYTQANILIVPKDTAVEVMAFCLRNPKPCPLIEVLEPGNPFPIMSCNESDIRTDLNKYRIYSKGELVKETDNILDYWREDFVSFLIGCSFTFENALINANISLRHVEENKRVSMYNTNIDCARVNGIGTKMVVSMRPIRKKDLVKTIMITSRYPSMHGAPIHIGEPEEIGIKDIMKPDLGDAVIIKEDEIPVFWACGGTVFNMANQLNCDIAITHAPSQMYVLDLKDDDFCVL